MGSLGKTTQMANGGYGYGTPRLPYHSKMVGYQNENTIKKFESFQTISAGKGFKSLKI